MNKEFFKTEIEKIKREMKINTGFISDYHFDMGRKSAFGESQQAVKEALLEMLERTTCIGCSKEYSLGFARARQNIIEVAKEDLGIDLDSQQDEQVNIQTLKSKSNKRDGSSADNHIDLEEEK